MVQTKINLYVAFISKCIKIIRRKLKKVLEYKRHNTFLFFTCLACFEDWKKLCFKWILSREDYFKGDEIDVEEKTKIFYFTNKFTLVLAHSSIYEVHIIGCPTLPNNIFQLPLCFSCFPFSIGVLYLERFIFLFSSDRLQC